MPIVLRNLGIFVLSYLAVTAIIGMVTGRIEPPSIGALIAVAMGGTGVVLGTLRRQRPSAKHRDTLQLNNAEARASKRSM